MDIKEEVISDDETNVDYESVENIQKFLDSTYKSFKPVQTNSDVEESLIKVSTEYNSDTNIIGADNEILEPETIIVVYEDENEESTTLEYRVVIDSKDIKVECLSEDDINETLPNDPLEPLDIAVCVRCSATFENLKELGVHYRAVHYKKRKFVWSQLPIFVKKKKSNLNNVKSKAKSILEMEKADAKKDTVTFKPKVKSEPKTENADDKKDADKFWCNRCEESFDTYRELHHHRTTDKHARSDVCDICYKKFKYKYLMRLHRNSHLSSDQRLLVNYRCILCDIEVNTFPQVLLHYEDKHAGRRKCILCGIFVCQGYKKHLRSHRKRVYKCLPCNRSFNSNAELIKHYHSDEHKEMKKCKICKQSFPTPARVRSHMITAHKTGKPLQCELCGVTCRTLSTLNRHKKRKHLKDQMIICEVCGKSFFTKKAVEKHIITAHETKPLFCYICLSEFKTPELLEEHYEVHTEHESVSREAITCECGMKLENPCVAFQHSLNVHHLYSCYKCNQTFPEKKNLTYHLKSHDYSHRIKITESGTMCLVCMRIFKYKSSLRYHMYCHTGEKLYDCSVCKKSFRKPYHLKLHMRTHTKEKPYACDKCNKSFTSKPAIKYHLAQVHKTGSDMYQCNICFREFKSEFLCRGHQQRMHFGDKKDKPKCVLSDELLSVPLPPREPRTKSKSQDYKCEFCIRVFKSENACKNHTRKYHPQQSKDLEEIDMIEILDPRRKDCLYCHRYFKSELAFNNHLQRAHPQQLVNGRLNRNEIAGQDGEEAEVIEIGEEEEEDIADVEGFEAQSLGYYRQDSADFEEDDFDEDQPMEIVTDEGVENILERSGGVIVEEYVGDSDDETNL